MASEKDRDVADRRDDQRDGRDESPTERADRNWIEVLQELRVMQTGAQILTGFLLALAFQPAFTDLDGGQRVLYLVLVVLAALSAIIALAPVALHRTLFQQRAKRDVVVYGHAALITCLVTVAVLLLGVVAFVFDVVLDTGAAVITTIALAIVLVVLWIATPMIVRVRHAAEKEPS